MFSLYCFGFEGWIWVLIASAHELCILFTTSILEHTISIRICVVKTFVATSIHDF